MRLRIALKVYSNLNGLRLRKRWLRRRGARYRWTTHEAMQARLWRWSGATPPVTYTKRWSSTEPVLLPVWPAAKPFPKFANVQQEELFYASWDLSEVFDRGEDMEPNPVATSNLSRLRWVRGH